MSNHRIIYPLAFLLLLIFAILNESIGQSDSCKDILRDGIFDDQHRNWRQINWEIRKLWLCNQTYRSETSKEGKKIKGAYESLGFDLDYNQENFRGFQNNFCQDEQAANYSQYEEFFESRIANKNIVNAWRKCMGDKYGSGLSSEVIDIDSRNFYLKLYFTNKHGATLKNLKVVSSFNSRVNGKLPLELHPDGRPKSIRITRIDDSKPADIQIEGSYQVTVDGVTKSYKPEVIWYIPALIKQNKAQVIRAEIIKLINTLPRSSKREKWNSGDPNPDINVDCWATLTPSSYSVNHAGGDTFNITRRFNAFGHCNRSKHPQGVPECNCNGPVSATAVIEVQKTGLLKVSRTSANVSGCSCLEGRGLGYVRKTVELFNDQSIGLSALAAGN